jgi:hypothetical protein
MLEKIPIPFEEFKEVLDANKKVLFSGIFGSGKTTFLNDFFNEDDSYESIHIYPVNYSIASNEDIFELIKYDILFQLIGKVPKDEFLKLEIPYELTLYTYLTSTLDLQPKLDFLVSFLNFAGKYGTATLKVYEKLKNLKDKFLEFHAQFQEDDFSKVEKYLTEPVNEKGHIYEEDFFTRLIRILVGQVKQESKKELVLVIDDLDRLDPEHIFRILNIFSAHIDFLNVENQNKFDFDKIVLVCDFRNLESIFYHKYGLDSDFKGYIDKFYENIFWHNPSKIIQKTVEVYLGKINLGENRSLNHETRLGNHIKYILNSFLEYNLISFRDLIRFQNELNLKHLDNYRENSPYRNKSLLNYFPLNVELVIYFLIVFFNNDELLLKKIKQAERRIIKNPFDRYDDNNLDKICELILLIQHDTNNRDDIYKNNRENFELKYLDYRFMCNVAGSDYFNCIVHRETISGNIMELNYFEILFNAAKVYFTYIK